MEINRIENNDNGDNDDNDDNNLEEIIEDYRNFNSVKRRKTNKYNIELSKVYCCVCLSDSNDKFVYYSKISELNTIVDNSLFLSPCGKHFICKECLKKICMDFENHPVNNNFSHIRCLYSNNNCLTPEGVPYFFEHADMKKILTEEHYDIYYTYVERYEFLGFDVIRCDKVNFKGETCNLKIAVCYEDINDNLEGVLVIECPDTLICGNRFCYNCRKPISYMYDTCEYCENLHEYDNPYSLNKFLVRQIDEKIKLHNPSGSLDQQDYALVSRKITEESDYLYRNWEITESMALEYIYGIVYDDSDKISLQCPICLNYFYKSEKCSALKHCGIERCYSCGKIQNKTNMYGLGDHWSEMGKNGCPRFDTAPYWDCYANCEYRCSDEIFNSNYCHSHIKGECTNNSHKIGKAKLNHERKQALIYHFLKSLPSELRNRILDELGSFINIGFMRKVFYFLEKNKKYINYYTPLTFIDKIDMEY